MENKTLKHFIKKRKFTLIISFKKKRRTVSFIEWELCFMLLLMTCRYYEVQLHAPLSRMFDAVILLGRFDVR